MVLIRISVWAKSAGEGGAVEILTPVNGLARRRSPVQRRGMAVALLIILISGVSALITSSASAQVGQTSQQVQWGANNNCNGPKIVEAAPGEVVNFRLCVTQNGQPLGNHQLFYNVTRPDGSTQNAIPLRITGTDGMTELEFVGDSPGNWAIEICDSAGCVWGQGQVVVLDRAPTDEQTQQPQPSDRFTWVFADAETFQNLENFQFGRPVHLILSSNRGEDVRQLLPIMFQVFVGGQLAGQSEANDPSTDCRPDGTACSADGPVVADPGPGVAVEIVAVSMRTGQPIELSRCPVREGTTTEQPVTRTPQGQTTVPREQDFEDFSQTTGQQTCWWCWGIKFLILLSMFCVLFIWVSKTTWWHWCFWWFLIIFIWIPFLLNWLHWVGPWWWWIPLLGWLPVIGFGTYYFSSKMPGFKPWMWWVAGIWGAVILLGLLIFDAVWWFLLPVFWVPTVGLYLWVRGTRQPWWRTWMWYVFGGYMLVIFTWGALWNFWWWFIPLFVVPAGAWWWFSWTKQERSVVGPKLCFILPWAWFPALAWGNWEFGLWWCWIDALFLTAFSLCVIFKWTRRTQWWDWCFWFFVLIFVWAPFLIVGLVFFGPGWAWLAFAGWLPLIWAGWYYYGRHQSWWQPWLFTAGLIWSGLVVLGVILAAVSNPKWWYHLPVFWLPWVGLYLWVRGTRMSWWKPWMWWAFGIYVLWPFVWIIWLGGFWWWVIPALAVGVLWWWFSWNKQSVSVIRQKLCFLTPWILLPPLVFAVFHYCQYLSYGSFG